MYSPINHHCDKINFPNLGTIQQERKETPDQQQFDKYSS